jgi:hypothetical protein
VSRRIQLTSWDAELTTRFPDFPAPVVAVLALYSFGLVLAHACGLSAVALFLAGHLGAARDALRKRLREFYLDARDKSGSKRGQKRKDFDPALAFAPLLRWVLSLWDGRYLPLAIDVTNLGERFHVLAVSVVVRGLAIPVAWKVLPGGVKDPWHPHWCALLAALKPAVPEGWTVAVASDRGLESPALFAAIAALGWHPLMRVKKGGSFRPAGWGHFYPMQRLAGRVGVSFGASGLAYGGTKLRCTLLARWEVGYAEPWLVLTDLPPEAASAVWYSLRTWIEQGFKVIKGGGWEWDRTRMEDPSRVQRLWLVLAVATLWVVALGVEDEAREAHRQQMRRTQRQINESAQQARAREQAEQVRRQRQQEALQARRQRQEKRQQARANRPTKVKAVRHADTGATALRRAHRVSVRGLAALSAAWARGESPLPRHLHPEPWPLADQVITPLNEQDFLPRQT